MSNDLLKRCADLLSSLEGSAEDNQRMDAMEKEIRAALEAAQCGCGSTPHALHCAVSPLKQAWDEMEHRSKVNSSQYLNVLERVRKLEALHITDLKIPCPSTNGYHRCALEADHPGDHKGINGKEEWYAWERAK
jgi:hypothetical protein